MKAITPLEENTGENMIDLGSNKELLYAIHERKIYKLDFTKIKFCYY